MNTKTELELRPLEAHEVDIRELSEHETSAVHGSSFHGIPLDYKPLYAKFAADFPS
jgi:hypothetical protein